MLLCEIILTSLLKIKEEKVAAVLKLPPVGTCPFYDSLEISMDHRGMDIVQSKPNMVACKCSLISVLIYAHSLKILFMRCHSSHVRRFVTVYDLLLLF